MSKIDRISRKIARKEERINRDKEIAQREKEEAEEARKQAVEDIKEAKKAESQLKKAKKKAEVAQRKVDEAQQAYDEIQPKNNNKKYIITGISCFLGSLILAGGIYVLTRQSKTGQVKIINNEPTSSMSDSINVSNTDVLEIEIDKQNEQSNNNSNDNYNNQNEDQEVVVTEPANISNDDKNDYIELTEESFETLVGTYVTKYANKYSNVSTEDILKFIALINIDEIVESNEDLANKLFTYSSEEEFLNDAAKVIGATVMYDINVWNKTRSTDGFINVSDAVIGSQKEQMIKIENYVDRIAAAVNAGDAELVNSIVAEFLEDMTCGELSKLDDGVGFASQVYIALISDGIAKDYLNQENFDMLQILKGSEKYISNIFAVYNKCNNNGKTLGR